MVTTGGLVGYRRNWTDVRKTDKSMDRYVEGCWQTNWERQSVCSGSKETMVSLCAEERKEGGRGRKEWGEARRCAGRG